MADGYVRLDKSADQLTLRILIIGRSAYPGQSVIGESLGSHGSQIQIVLDEAPKFPQQRRP
jgi:hypothetical protein